MKKKCNLLRCIDRKGVMASRASELIYYIQYSIRLVKDSTRYPQEDEPCLGANTGDTTRHRYRQWQKVINMYGIASGKATCIEYNGVELTGCRSDGGASRKPVCAKRELELARARQVSAPSPCITGEMEATHAFPLFLSERKYPKHFCVACISHRCGPLL